MPDNSHSRFIPAGMTRDCLDPWVYVQVGTDGGISACCVRAPIGNLASQSLADILNGAEARSLRYALLSGQPDDICRGCGLRGMTDPAILQAKVRRILKSISLPKDFDAERYLDANPDVRAAGADAVDHFLAWGRLEGRDVRPATDTDPTSLRVQRAPVDEADRNVASTEPGSPEFQPEVPRLAAE